MNRRDYDTTESAIVRALFPKHGAGLCRKYMPERSLHSIRLYAHRNGIQRDKQALKALRIKSIPMMNQIRLGAQHV